MANNNPTFGELLRSLNNDPLKNKIRNIEKLKKKTVNIKNCIDYSYINKHYYYYISCLTSRQLQVIQKIISA